jgi:histidyl-tRNA synthetase
MHDILPADLPAWQLLERTVKDVLASYGFAEIRVPVVEKTELFARAIGGATDIVEKEMYSFEDRNGDSLSLRPEGTAGVVRAALQNNLLYAAPVRLWYMGPMFRRERPQRGRTRQFHQMGAEVFGAPGPDADAELLSMCHRIWSELGLKGLRLELNSLGTAHERARFRNDLREYLGARKDRLDDDSRKRLDHNPLRILDSKNPETQALLEGAPALGNYLGEESQAHFDGCRRLLDRMDVEYLINPRLVRGLDYYCHTVFEWITDELGAQGTVCAGGRYDGLVEIQGGKPWPGTGFAMGQERLVELIRRQGDPQSLPPHVYLVMSGPGTTAEGLALAESLRRSVGGLRIQSNISGGSFKSQFKRADRSQAQLALILGEEELEQRMVSIKHLRSEQGQLNLSLDSLGAWLRDWLATA